MKNIWVDDTTQQAIDLSQVAAIEIENNETTGTIALRFDFIVSGFVHIKIESYDTKDADEYIVAQGEAAKYFNKVVAQWKGGAK